MSNMSEYSVGLAHELCITAAKAGFSPEELYKLSQSENTMRQMRQVLLGHASISIIDHLIDLDADPFVPQGWKVEEHRKGGQFKWDASKVALCLSELQKRDGIEGNKLRTTLAEQNRYNANMLDYLLANPHLIPEEWKSKYVFFWGTVYRRSFGNLCVRYLYRSDVGWFWGDGWLDGGWGGDHPAAVSAS